MRIYLIGYMGSGKSTLGRALAKRIGYRFVDIDSWIEQQVDMRVFDYFTTHGEEAFREREREALTELTTLPEDVVIATGGGTPCFFDNMERMNSSGLTIYLKVDPAKLAVRLEAGRAKRPLLHNKSVSEIEAFAREALAVREPYYHQAKLVLACDHLSDEYIARHMELYVAHSTAER